MRSPKAAPDAARAPRLDRPSFGQRLLADIRKNWILYVMVLPVLAYYLLFSYVPMAGIQLAFKKYMKGHLGQSLGWPQKFLPLLQGL